VALGFHVADHGFDRGSRNRRFRTDHIAGQHEAKRGAVIDGTVRNPVLDFVDILAALQPARRLPCDP
jgi:hypothetical protein